MTIRLSSLLAFIVIFTGTLWADDYSGFKIPEHRVFSLTGALSGNYRNSSSESESTYRSINQRWSFNSNLSTACIYLLDSDPIRSQISVQGILSGSQQRERRTQGGSSGETINQTKYVNELLDLDWSGWVYPLTIPLGINGSASGNATYQQAWNSTVDRNSSYNYIINEYGNDRSSWAYRYTADIGLGVGYGHVRDATSVFDVLILESRLKKEGILSAPLSDATRQKLISLYYRRNTDYGDVFERPDRYFWRDVEAILQQDPGLKSGSLDAYGLYRIAEPVDGVRYARQTGFFIGPKVQANHKNWITRQNEKYHAIILSDTGLVKDSTSSLFYRYTDRSDRFELGGIAEYHLPIGDRWQFDAYVEAYHPLKNLSKAYLQNSRLLVQYTIADRWQAYFRFVQNREYYQTKHTQYKVNFNRWSIDGICGLRYFIEDHLALDLSVDHYQHKESLRFIMPDSSYTVMPQSRYQRDTYASIGLTYFFTGAYLPGTQGDPKPAGSNY